MTTYCRKLYDHRRLLERTEESKSNGNFTLSTKPKQHIPTIPQLTTGPVSDSYFNPHNNKHVGNMVDLESSLKGVTTDSDISRMMNMYGKLPKNNGMASEQLLTSESRLDGSRKSLRDGYKPRFDHPIGNPLKRVFNGVQGTKQIGDNRFGINTRHETRDAINMEEYNKAIDEGPPNF